ncbi:MAG: transglycosylase SLT domain-containing protein, partial [Gammaproteobacteria bacterium]
TTVGQDGRSVLLRTTSWRALKPDGQPDNLSTTIGRWLELYLPLGIRETRVDLGEPLDQLGALLASVVIEDDLGRRNALLDSVAIDGVRATDGQVIVTLGMEVPLVQPSAPRTEQALDDTEIARLEEQLDSVVAFFTYTIRSLADSSAPDPDALLDVLLPLRLALIEILSDPRRRDRDPARTLFVQAWDGLAPVLRLVAEEQPDHDSALRYLGFIGGGEALKALDALGPAAGIEISTDGLRRLARMLIPTDPADPLDRSDAVDPALRRALGFGAPLPPPEHYVPTSWIDWLIPRAVAAAGLDPAIAERLNRWVPSAKDADRYLPMVREVLHHAVAEQRRANQLDPAYHDVYRRLVFATAWQESCWRQFTAKDDKRVPVQSASGDLGMMQINPKVWRGLYDLQGMRWDIVYNARAGADILDHYLTRYALQHREQTQSGGIDNLARSSYSAYNGGPKQYARYRQPGASVQGKKIDALFNEKYRALKTGGELAVTACYR